MTKITSSTDQPSQSPFTSETLFSHRGITTGNGESPKQYHLAVTWNAEPSDDPRIRGEISSLAIVRTTHHQTHHLTVTFTPVDNGNGGTKFVPSFSFVENEHPSNRNGFRSMCGKRKIDLFTLTHLLVNITDAELNEIANRTAAFQPLHQEP